MAVYLTFLNNSIFLDKQTARRKQHNIRKRVFDYDAMDNDQWDKFTTATNDIVDDKLLSNLNINDTQDLSLVWNDISRGLRTVAMKTITNHNL